jgi:hypothetical protein
MAPMTFATLRERQAALLERMAALERLRDSGELSEIAFGLEVDRLTEELLFVLRLAKARVQALQGGAGP